LIQVTEARARATSVQVSGADLSDPAKVAQFQQAQGQLSGSIGRLLASVEAYPELKSNANFLALQSQLEGTENRINVSTKDYNEAVQAYNTRIRTFPDAIGAKIFYGSKPMTTYTATAPNADRAPTVKF
jgi:LemA protein